MKKDGKKRSNREVFEAAAGMALDDLFFIFNGIDPEAAGEQSEK